VAQFLEGLAGLAGLARMVAMAKILQRSLLLMAWLAALAVLEGPADRE
jgi:hypothetical protein